MHDIELICASCKGVIVVGIEVQTHLIMRLDATDAANGQNAPTTETVQ